MRGWLIGIIALGVVNFTVYFIVAVIIGGDAVSGYVADGHYYLASHGHYTAVTREIFTYSRWHVCSLFITHPAAILAATQLNRMRRRR